MPPKKTSPPKAAASKSSQKAKAPAKGAAKEEATCKPAAAAKVEEKPAPKPLPVVEIGLKELPNAILNDSTTKIKESGRWPLVIDPAGRAPTFLKYQNLNFLNAVSPDDMVGERVRKALIGALRYGKPLVIDMMEGDHLEAFRRVCDDIQTGLLDTILDKSILKDENYKKLVRANDDKDYHDEYYSPEFLDQFKLIFVTSLESPTNESMCCTIQFLLQ